MKSTLKQHTYQCKCGAITKEFVWNTNVPTTKINCSNCSELLDVTDLLNTNKNEAVSIRTPTKNR